MSLLRPDPAKLIHKIAFWRPGPLTGQDSTGQPNSAPVRVAYAKASIEDLTGREYWQAQQVKAGKVSRITVYYCSEISAIKKTWWIIHDGKRYDIDSINDIENRHVTLVLMCMEVET